MIPWKTQKQAKSYIHQHLASNPEAVKSALLVVYANQTLDEQGHGDVAYNNGVGFTVLDAEFLSSLARQLLDRGFLSDRQLQFAQEKLPKYWNQLRLYVEHK